MVSEHHILENLENEWFHEVHVKPLQAYLSQELPQPVLSEQEMMSN